MPREAPRTIHSALPPYQKDVSVNDYEVLMLDNGSSEKLPDSFIANLPSTPYLLRNRLLIKPSFAISVGLIGAGSFFLKYSLVAR